MRNLVECPITKEEILECLDQLILDFKMHEEGSMSCGDMRMILLAEAREIVAKHAV